MSEEILINVTPMECRVALVENGVVQELFVERTARRGLASNIYKGARYAGSLCGNRLIKNRFFTCQ